MASAVINKRIKFLNMSVNYVLVTSVLFVVKLLHFQLNLVDSFNGILNLLVILSRTLVYVNAAICF